MEKREGLAYVLFENNESNLYMPNGVRVPFEIWGRVTSKAHEQPTYTLQLEVNLFNSHEEAKEFYNTKTERNET